ncbi:MAG: hypothetical protein CMB99_09320 [Flavobacteriaceae bacterium]|nr:hypothetical protein [Flavobacteriaceae bacterium]|tara:strand:+ start:472263 stop:473318 length:1056 start_codon:yes stop_codon:yes gene_type:complete
MTNSAKLFFVVLFLLLQQYCFGQYSISGYLDTPEKNKRVYLSILKFDELTAISDNQILTSTVTDSLGYFSFEGRLLSEKNAIYRIYANVDEEFGGVQKVETDELKNFHQFIFSNSDTLVFKGNKKFWFSTNTNTNLVDKQWRDFEAYALKLRREFIDFANKGQVSQSSSQYLYELKSYAINQKPHPLITLMHVADVPLKFLREDFKKDSKFYDELQESLNKYYGEQLYALQFREFVVDLNKEEKLEELSFYRSLTYTLGALSVLLSIGLFLVFKKLKDSRNNQVQSVSFDLTTQEEKVAELILKDKSNKEIATELFISLNTVKTHIRNLYGKMEVSNRRDFIEKFKNHPRD